MHNHNQMQLFRNVIDECDFLDLGFVRKKIAWSRHFANSHSIWESLDFQVLEFNIFTVIHQITILFLLILQVLRFLKETNCFASKKCGSQIINVGNKVEVARRNFFNPNLDREVLNKIDQCGQHLAWWNRKCFGSV